MMITVDDVTQSINDLIEYKGMTKLEALKLMRTVIDYEIDWLEVSGDEQ